MSSNILIFDENHENVSNIKTLCSIKDINIIDAFSLDQFQSITDQHFISVILINDKQKNILKFVTSLKNNHKFNLIPIIVFGQRILEIEKCKLIEAGVLDVLDFPLNPSIFLSRIKSAILQGQIFEQFAYNKDSIEKDKNNMFYNERLKISKELAMNLANQIKDHFNFILNCSSILLKKNLDSDVNESIQKINQYASSACNILNFMVEQTNLHTPNFKKTSIREIVDAAISKIKVQLSKNSFCPIKIFNNVYDIKFNLDQVNLEKAISNLLVNSCEAIFMKNDMNFCGVIEVNGSLSDTQYILSIKDNGIGILKDTITKIFNPFFSMKANKSGMGLTFAKQVIENSHRGSISVKSEISKECIFEITLPIK